MAVALGGFPVVVEPEVIPDLHADTRSFGFRSLDGQQLIECSGREFIALWGTQGLDVPARQLAEEPVPFMDGTLLTDITIGSRPVVLPMWVGADSGHRGYLDNRAALRRLFNHRRVDYRANDGHLDLLARSELGERSLRVAYRDGFTGDWTQDAAGAWWERVALQFTAVNPYWHGERWETPRITAPTPVNTFGSFPLRLSSSRAFGSDIPVLVGGEVESWPRIDVVGPATSVTISASGTLVEIPAGLAAGEVVVIDLNPRSTAALFNGAVGWARIASTWRRAALEPGVQPISITIPGATSQTSAVVSGDTNYETPW